MSLNLPAPREGRLANSPLQLVACQLNYVDPASPLTARVSAEIVHELEASGYKYPKVDPVRVTSVSLDLGGTGGAVPTPGTGIPATAYRLTSDDSRWRIMLSPDSLSLETQRYGRWHTDFREHFVSILSAVAHHIRPAVRARLGLRYVDLLSDPLVDNVRAWSGRIRSEFLGPLTDADFAPGVMLTQQQLTLDISDGLRAVLRHGCFRDPDEEPGWRYLIDTDVFQDAFLRFETSDVEETLDAMHQASKQLFEYVITPEYYDALIEGTANR